MNIMMAGDPRSLEAEKPDITVEAAYGLIVVEGTRRTMEHHVRPGECPCLAPVSEVPFDGKIGISHVDLDTVGGCGAAMGRKPGTPTFWALAALVDVTGPHNPEVRKHPNYPDLLAYWAWSQRLENRAPLVGTGGGVLDVTALVGRCLNAVEQIFQEDPHGPLHQAGQDFKDYEAQLAEESLVAVVPKGDISVAIRSSEHFVNHLYTLASGMVVGAIVAYNTEKKSVTLSFKDCAARGKRNAADIMRRVFGPEAGGHPGIAGSPRGQEFTERDGDRVVALL